MVLAVMVVVLCYRVYQVVNPPVEGEKTVYRNPDNDPDNVIAPPPPPAVPVAPPTDNWSPIWRTSIFKYQLRTDRRAINEEAEQSVNLELLDIKEVRDGVYRARIRSAANTTKWYDEGDPFESYTLQSIDPDTDSCVIFAEEISRSIELFIE